MSETVHSTLREVIVSNYKNIRKRTRPSQKINASNREGHFGGKVGYGNPPKSGQFKKGQSGNPNGRPKGKAKNIAAIVQAELKSEINVLENGERTARQPLEIMLKQLSQKAMKGDLKAQKLYFEFLARYGDFEDVDINANALSPDEEALLRKLFLGKVQTDGGDDE